MPEYYLWRLPSAQIFAFAPTKTCSDWCPCFILNGAQTFIEVCVDWRCQKVLVQVTKHDQQISLPNVKCVLAIKCQYFRNLTLHFLPSISVAIQIQAFFFCISALPGCIPCESLENSTPSKGLCNLNLKLTQCNLKGLNNLGKFEIQVLKNVIYSILRSKVH